MQTIGVFVSGNQELLQDSAPVILFLHGYGANERDLVDLTEQLPKLPWFSVRAPEESPYGGYSWFKLSDPNNPDQQLVEEATNALWHWVDEYIPKNPLIVIGFSQGALMATQLLRTRPNRVMGTVILSGFILNAMQSADEELKRIKPKVIYCRGIQDPLISQESIARTNLWLQHHTKALTKAYDNLAHSVDQRVMKDVSDYITTTIGSTQ
ncbi:MAG: hypothetical protein RIQ88_869 [Actinomycetota bacterium]